MHKSPIYDSIEVRSLGTHPDFYVDPYEALYMHHKDCRPEHLTKLLREKLLPLPPWQDTTEPRKGGIPPGLGPKQIPLPSQAIENPRKGGSPPRFNLNGIPPGFGPQKILPQVNPKEKLASSNCSQLKQLPELNPRELLDPSVVLQAEKDLLNVNAQPKNLAFGALESREHMIVDKYQFVPKACINENLCLYDNGKGTLFQLLSLRNGKAMCQSEISRYPMVYKYLHVNHLTYTFRDKEGNEYRPYPMTVNSLSKEDLEKLRTCAECLIHHWNKDCPVIAQYVQPQAQEAIVCEKHSTKQLPKPESPPRSPPKQQVLPQETTDLSRSQVMEPQVQNAKKDQDGNEHMSYYRATDMSKVREPTPLESEIESKNKDQSHVCTRNKTSERSTMPDNGAQLVGNVETICEDLSSNTYSSSQPLTGSETSMRGCLPQQPHLRPSQSQDRYVQTTSKLEKKPLNSVKESSLGLELNMRLSFQAKNVHGTLVYQAPFKKFLVKLEDVTTPYEAKPFVNFQEDSSMSIDGARYLYTEEPWSVNNLGVRVELPCISEPREPGPLIDEAK